MASMGRRQFVTAEEAVDAFAGSPPLDFVGFRADLDAVIDQNIWTRPDLDLRPSGAGSPASWGKPAGGEAGE